MTTPIKKKLSKLINFCNGRALADPIFLLKGREPLQVAKCNEILHPMTKMKLETVTSVGNIRRNIT